MANRRRRRLSDKKCVLVTGHSETRGRVDKAAVENIPCVFWPDGHVCWEANMYLLNEWELGRSTRNNGGTLATYASQLSHIVRYVHRRKLSFNDLRDGHIRELSITLTDERHPRNPAFRYRTGTQTNIILRRSIEFLTWCQKLLYPDTLIVGEEGCGAQISITYRMRTIGKERDGRPRVRKYIWHEAMRKNESARVVQPIGKQVLDMLLTACELSSKRPYTVNRRRMIQKLAAEVGARRTELSLVKIEHVREALDRLNKSGAPVAKMKFLTIKQRREGPHQTDENVLEEREAPVSRELLTELARFIKIHRSPLINRLKKSGRLASDPEYVFLTEKGRPIRPETLTKELAGIRKIAGITQRAYLHMYRHRRITLLVIEYVKAVLENHVGLDISATLLTKVASITGHHSIDSLWTYIDTAFDELGIWKKTDQTLAIRANMDSIFAQLAEIHSELPRVKADMSAPVRQLLDRVDYLVTSLLKLAQASDDAGNDQKLGALLQTPHSP